MRKKNGFVLLLSIVIMIVLSAIVAGLIVNLTTDIRGTAVQMNDAKAFWIAEAGIADAVKRLKNSEITLSVGGSNSSISNVSFGGGTYSVSMTRPVSDVVLTSTGTYNSQSRQITQTETVTSTLNFPSAFSYAVYIGTNPSGNHTINIGNTNAHTVIVSGNVYYNPTAGTDSVVVKNNSQVINGYIYADSVTGGGTYTQAPSYPSPAPTFPSFTKTTYDNAITQAESDASVNLTLSGVANLNLAGQTLYYKSVTIKDNATVTGPGSIVATKAVDIKNSSGIGAQVNLISAKVITIQDTTTVQSGGLVYSQTNVIVKDNANVISVLMAPEANQQVKVLNSATFQGIIFADIANVQDDAVVRGSVVANELQSDNIINQAAITHNSSYLPASLPTGFTTTTTYTYAKKANSWAEV